MLLMPYPHWSLSLQKLTNKHCFIINSFVRFTHTKDKEVRRKGPFVQQITTGKDLKFDLVSQLRSGPTIDLPLTDPRTHTDNKENDMFPQFYQNVEIAGGLFKLPSVSMVIKDTMSPESKAALEKWKQNMILKLGEAGFALYQREIFQRGERLHTLIETCFKNNQDPNTLLNAKTDKIVENYWKSMLPVLTKIKNVKLIEQRVVHPLLLYRGIVDCVAEIDGQLHVIDWKTAEKQKNNVKALYDAPLQVVAYLGALNYDTRILDTQMQNATIVVANGDGSPGDVYHFGEKECKTYWKAWNKKLHDFWFQKLIEFNPSFKEDVNNLINKDATDPEEIKENLVILAQQKQKLESQLNSINDDINTLKSKIETKDQKTLKKVKKSKK